MNIQVKEKKVIKSFGLLPSTVKKIDELKKVHGVSRSEIVDQIINFNGLNVYDYEISMHVKAVSKQRPAYYKGRTITPEATRRYEAKVKKFMSEAWQHEPLETALKVSVVFQFKKPATSKKSYPPRKDVDNLAKAFLDACNGTIFIDDSQIVELKASKCFGEDDRVKFFCSEI